MKIGLFFGSFNPIHIGHLAIANYMVEYTEMDQVWFVVSPHNPLKEKSTLLADHHRLRMVSEAIDGYDKFRASDIEFKLPQPSYTINTLAYLKEKYPDHTFSLIMGSDNLSTIHKWKNFEQLLNDHKVFIYPRPNFTESEYSKHKNVVITKAPLMDISSTFLREAIKNKKDIRCFMNEKAFKYLTEMNFYK